jgi:hypothetical protein
MHNTAFSPVSKGVILGLRKAHETARVHIAARQRGGMAGRGAARSSLQCR